MRAVSDAIRDDLVEAHHSHCRRIRHGGVKVIPAVLSGSPVRAIADYTNRVSADLIVVEKKARRGSGYWSAGSFAVALGKAVKAPTIAVPSDDPGRQIRARSSGISSCRPISRKSRFARCPKLSFLHSGAGDPSCCCMCWTVFLTKPSIQRRVGFA